MKHRNPGSKRVITALVPLGALGAVVAGCGGGGGASVPHQPAAQPNSTTPSASKNGTTTALLTITIPARGALSQRAKRSVKYISQASAAIGVSIGTTGGPSPAPTYFSLPTPGPQPTSTTLPVGAPIGNDTVSVSILDALPSATASPNVLSRGTTTATVASGSSQPIAVQALGVAAGIVLASGAPSSFEVFENHPVAQATTIAATPVDADGYAIAGPLASPVPLSAPAGVTLSPATLTVAGPVTVTYGPSQHAIGGTLSGGLPLDTAAGSTDNFTVLATQYFFVLLQNGTNETLTAIDPVRAAVVATVVTSEPASGNFAVTGLAGCASGETALFARMAAGAGQAAGEVSFPIPSASASPIAADLTGAIGTASSSVEGTMLASDAACNAYSAGDGSTPNRYSGFGSSVTATALSASGWNATSSLGVVGATLYGSTITTTGTYPNSSTAVTAQSIPAAGGTVTNTGTVQNEAYLLDYGICVGGTAAYELTDSCGDDYLTAIPQLTTVDVIDADSCAVAPNGTVYIFTGATAITEPSPVVGLAGEYGGVMTDGRYLASVLPTNPVTVQIYAVPSAPNAAPVAVGTPIPLTNAGTSLLGAAFPR